MESVLISQPVHQQAYQTVAGAQSAGLLHSFHTGFYRTGRGVSDARLLGLLPSRLRRAAERQLRRRWHTDIDPSKVSLGGVDQIALLAVRRALEPLGYQRWTSAASFWDLDRWASSRFDVTVARRLRTFVGEVRLVHAWEGSALHTLEEAKRLRMTTVLDVPAAHEANQALLIAAGLPTAPAALRTRVLRERRVADYMFAPSDFVIDELLNDGHVASTIVKIPYGADPTIFQPPVKASPDGPFRVLFAGRIGLRKGVTSLLEAWRATHIPNGELVLVGDADREGADLLAQNTPRVRHLPAVPISELYAIYRSADVFVFPSLSEGSAMVTYIAMAAGLPVVTTYNSGSVVTSELDGFIVPPGDVDALAACIQRLHDDPNLRERMGRTARNTITNYFTWQHYRHRVAAAYEAILSGGDPVAAVARLAPKSS